MKFFLNWPTLVDFLLYGLLLTSVGYVLFLLMASDLKIRYTHYRYRLRIKKANTQVKVMNIPQKRWFRHLYKLLTIRSNKADVTMVYGFLLVEGFVSIGVFVTVLLQINDLIIALLCSWVALIIPYLFLYVSARSIRNEVGSNVQELIETLIHSYSASRFDMYVALSETHAQLKQKEMKNVIARLINDLQTAHDEETLRDVVDFFIFATGSSWGMRLGNIILKAYVQQENVNTALLTLQQQMYKQKKMMEEEKAGAMDVFFQAMLALILFPLSLLGANRITNPQNWWALQFQESYAFLSFIVTVLFVMIAGLVGYIIRKPRHDL